MGGVSWSVHNNLEKKSEQKKIHILKRRYEERQKEIKVEQELKEKEEREFQNKRLSALEDMNNSL